MAKIALVGGHGKIALLAAPKLAEDGHSVTAFIRNPEHAADVQKAGATPVVADIEHLDTPEIAEILRGHDAVLWSAGAGGGSRERTYAVDRDAAIRSMDAAKQAGVTEYVMVSYFGARPDHGVPEENGFFAYAEAKAAADAYLRESDLAWTVLKPSSLTDDAPTGRIDDGSGDSSQVSRGDVAEVIRQVFADPAAVARRDIAFNNGDLEIGAVLRG